MQSHVVIIGAGFGGLEVARGLPSDTAVTVIDRNNFHTFQPLLYQVATAGLNAADVAHPVRGLFHRQPNVDFLTGEVEAVDWDARRVRVAGQSDVAFDHLVIAAGASANYFGVPGAAAHAYPLYQLADAVRLRNHVLECFEQADRTAGHTDGLLRFAVIGGGPTGVETAGALAELVDAVLSKDFPRLDLSRVEITLVEREQQLLAPFGEKSRRHALETLEARGVVVRFGHTVAEVTPERLVFGDGSSIDVATTIWAAGVAANPLAARLDLPVATAGRIVANADLSVAERADVWVVGDIAHIDSADGPLPQLAPVAMQSGRHVARQIGRVMAGEATEAFHYRDKGTMATIGRRAAVAELPGGIHLSGTLAWFAWLGLHLVFLVGRRNRLSVLLNWGWNYFTWDRGPRLIFRPEPGVASADGSR